MAGRADLNVEQEIVVVVALVAVATALAGFASGWLGPAGLSLIYLVAVTLAGGFIGLRAALVASVASFLACNFLFTEPRFTFAIARSEDVASLVAFLLVSLIVGHLAGRLRERATEARRNAERVEVLFEFSRRIATAVDEDDLLGAAAQGIGAVLERRVIVLAAGADGRLRRPADEAAAARVDAAVLAAAQRASSADEPMPDDVTAAWYEPVTGLGVVVVESGPRAAGLDDEGRRLLFALRMQLAAAWERLRLHRAAADARVDAAAARLRATLLASVSHDLRTPLVSIIGALSGIAELEGRLSSADRLALLDTALAEAERLNRLVQNLLDMTRLSHGALRPRQAAVDVAEVAAAAAGRLAAVFADRPLELRIAPQLPPARADRTLLEQVLVNLLENAAKYSPPAEPVRLEAACDGDRLRIRVVDRGPGIPAAERERVFEPFARAGHGDAAVPGQGLGLPICRGFVEAMEGHIGARDGPDGRGTIIEVDLPVAMDASPPAAGA